MTATAASGLPFDDIRALLRSMPGPQREEREAARDRNAALMKPVGSLGRLEDIALWLAAWQAGGAPSVTRPLVALFAASHGFSSESPETARRLMEAFAAGGGAVNQMCIVNDLGLKIFDLALDRPTPDIARGPALGEADCAATIAFGMEAIAGGTDLLVLGEVSTGGAEVAAAICHGLYGGDAADWTGPADAARVRGTVAFHKDHLDDPLELLRRLGGRDVAAIAGAILAARHQRIPVLLDGYAVCAAAAVLQALDATALDHCLAAHRAADAPHGRLLQRLGLSPLLDLGLRLEHGTGAALAVGLVRAAAQCHTGMATREQAGVTA